MTDPMLINVPVCRRCLDGEGGECHMPGCSFWMHLAPPEGGIYADPAADIIESEMAHE